MSQFLGTHQHRLDAKGRVSVPAPFRMVLKSSQDGTVILRPSHKYACVEAWPNAVFAALAAPLERMDLFSATHDDLSAALYADAYPVEADKEGRILLPGGLVAHAGLSDAVTFIGMGSIFHIWEPKAGAVFSQQSRARAGELTLPRRVN